MGSTAHRLSKKERIAKKIHRDKAIKRRQMQTNGNTFSLLRHDLYIHPKFVGLSGSAVKTFIYLLGSFRGHNNGEITCPERQCLQLIGISKPTFVKAINELIQADFVEIVELSTNNSPTLFGLTCFPILNEEKPSDRWKK